MVLFLCSNYRLILRIAAVVSVMVGAELFTPAVASAQGVVIFTPHAPRFSRREARFPAHSVVTSPFMMSTLQPGASPAASTASQTTNAAQQPQTSTTPSALAQEIGQDIIDRVRKIGGADGNSPGSGGDTTNGTTDPKPDGPKPEGSKPEVSVSDETTKLLKAMLKELYAERMADKEATIIVATAENEIHDAKLKLIVEERQTVLSNWTNARDTSNSEILKFQKIDPAAIDAATPGVVEFAKSSVVEKTLESRLETLDAALRDAALRKAKNRASIQKIESELEEMKTLIGP